VVALLVTGAVAAAGFAGTVGAAGVFVVWANTTPERDVSAIRMSAVKGVRVSVISAPFRVNRG
jgi:hypothetical protein